ncbi:MAG: hypothetical protein ACK5NT_13860 [Pyrinomonadaceae bacterium]
MKYALFFLIFTFFTTLTYSQPVRFIEFKKAVNVTNVTLARKDKDGVIEENVNEFSPTDIPILCFVDLSGEGPVRVTLEFIAVNVKSIKPNFKILKTSYQTKKDETLVTFTGKPEKLWFAGKYRVDILLNGKVVESRPFLVSVKE